jgi:AhpD family alkylhydroperoxidase
MFHTESTHSPFDLTADLDTDAPVLSAAAYEAGALDGKSRELIALAVGITVRCSGCVALHTRGARDHGANRNELLEAVGVALHMGGSSAREHGIEALRLYDRLSEDVSRELAG